MKHSIFLLGIISISLFLFLPKANALTINPDIIKNIFATATPTPTPTPMILKQIDPNLIQKIPITTLGAKNTVTPTPTIETKETSTPTPTIETKTTVTETPPAEENKATEAGTATDADASNAANTATPAGIQTKDIVTYVLIGAILVVLLAQAFWPKKGTSETKPEEPKNE